MKKTFSFILSLLFFSNALLAEQEYHPPIETPLIVTGTFGEFRGTHFHAGVDFSTQRRIGKKVYAIDSGHISRIKVAPDGYGNALYLTLNDGKTAVYGHLHCFSPKIVLRVYEEQVKAKSSFVEFTLDPKEMPVERGEKLGLSGDSGGVPPHLHFELRDAKENLLNPLLFGFQLKDTTAPKIVALAFVPFHDEGIPLEKKYWKILTPDWKVKERGYHLRSQRVPAGSYGIEIAIQDESSGNKCAPVRVTLSQGEKIFFQRHFEKLTWDDYKQNFLVYNRNLWLNDKGIFERLYNLPNGNLSFQNGDGKALGFISLAQNETAAYTIEIEDASQNRSTLSFTLTGAQPLHLKQNRPKENLISSRKKQKFSFLEKKIELNFPPHSIYYPALINAKEISSDLFPNKESIQKVVQLTPEDFLFKKEAELVFRSSTEELKEVDLYLFNQRKNGWKFIQNQKKSKERIEASINAFGIYSLLEDIEPPIIQPIRIEKEEGGEMRVLKFGVEDNLSGVNYRQIQVLENDERPLIFTLNLNQKEVAVPIDHKNRSEKIKIIVPDHSENKREIVVDLSNLFSKKPSQ